VNAFTQMPGLREYDDATLSAHRLLSNLRFGKKIEMTLRLAKIALVAAVPLPTAPPTPHHRANRRRWRNTILKASMAPIFSRSHSKQLTENRRHMGLA
jgi:hypothetical protein